TAEMLIQYYDFASSLLQDFDRGLRCFRHEIVVERVCPQKDLGPGTRSRPALMKPILEGLGRERRNLPFLWNTRGHLRQRPKPWQLREQVRESRSPRRQPRPFVDPSKCIGVNRTHPSLPVMREEFRFAGRHVHIDGTISLAALARQAQVKGFLHVFVPPTLANDVAMHHLP